MNRLWVAAAASVFAITATSSQAVAEPKDISDSVGDARLVQRDGNVRKATGDSDITRMSLSGSTSDSNSEWIRVGVKVREIDRLSRWDSESGTGLRIRSRFHTDRGAVVEVSGHESAYKWTSTELDEADCFGESAPELHYGRYSDMIRLDVPRDCFTGAQSVEISVTARLFRPGGRLVDNVTTEVPYELQPSS